MADKPDLSTLANRLHYVANGGRIRGEGWPKGNYITIDHRDDKLTNQMGLHCNMDMLTYDIVWESCAEPKEYVRYFLARDDEALNGPYKSRQYVEDVKEAYRREGRTDYQILELKWRATK